MGDNEKKTKQLTFDTVEDLLNAIWATEILDFDYAVERMHSEEDLGIIYLLIIYLED